MSKNVAFARMGYVKNPFLQMQTIILHRIMLWLRKQLRLNPTKS